MTTNIVERCFREVRRRTKGIGRFKDEEQALTVIYWQLKELKGHGVRMTGDAKAILAAIRTSKIQGIAS